MATENRLLSALSTEQREELVGLLRQLLVSFEGSTTEGSSVRLRLTLAPAHSTLEIRHAAGLPDVVGLLVREVEPDGPAAEAGIRVGDLLVAAEGTALRSVMALYAAVRERRLGGRLRLTGVAAWTRGSRPSSTYAPGPGTRPCRRGRRSARR